MRLETSKAVQALSASLQVEVIMEVQRQFIERVPFLKRVEGPCLVRISMAMRSGVLAPGELASRNSLYVIERGLVLHRGHILSTGKVWGDDVILSDTRYFLPFHARAMTCAAREHVSTSLRSAPAARLERIGVAWSAVRVCLVCARDRYVDVMVLNSAPTTASMRASS